MSSLLQKFSPGNTHLPGLPQISVVKADMTRSAQHIQILLVGVHVLFRKSLRALLNANPGCHVIAEAGDVAAAVRMVREHEPDIVLMNWEMSRQDALNILLEMAKFGPTLRTMLIGVQGIDIDLVRAIRLGVKAILSSEITGESLCVSDSRCHERSVRPGGRPVLQVLCRPPRSSRR